MTQAQRQLACSRLGQVLEMYRAAEGLLADVVVVTHDSRHAGLARITLTDARSLRNQAAELETYLTPTA